MCLMIRHHRPGAITGLNDASYIKHLSCHFVEFQEKDTEAGWQEEKAK